ncbi:MAG TPA: AAC(3) family N-acetyltransferase [Mycobacteriales bacterium]|nr:AAC(3) family N-acetyltransferase [Mycobacteriales bacterium]
MDGPQVGEQDIVAGLRQLGLAGDATVMVHSSLSSFGHVAGGARTVIDALREVCGTVVMLAGAGDLTRVDAPPGLIRPNNAYFNARTWAEFDDWVVKATPYRPNLPVDRWLGRIPHTLVHEYPSRRGPHPLLSFAAIGRHENEVIDAESPTDCLGPLRAVHELDGYVLQLGVTHTTNTTMHVAEQKLGRSLFYRYALNADGLWCELPNVPGESHEFDRIEPHLAPHTRTVTIGACRARLTRSADVIETTMRLIEADARALLCADPACRCGAAYQQRLAYLSTSSAAQSRRRHS